MCSSQGESGTPATLLAVKLEACGGVSLVCLCHSVSKTVSGCILLGHIPKLNFSTGSAGGLNDCSSSLTFWSCLAVVVGCGYYINI
jgi:hypothetical protein